jgi:small subunit ribosomal protein S14
MDMMRRRMVRDAEIPRLVLKSIVMSSRLPPVVRAAAQRQLSEMPANTSATRIRQRCIVTGRPRAVFAGLRLSRIALRDLASWGKMPGVCKVR